MKNILIQAKPIKQINFGQKTDVFLLNDIHVFSGEREQRMHRNIKKIRDETREERIGGKLEHRCNSEEGLRILGNGSDISRAEP